MQGSVTTRPDSIDLPSLQVTKRPNRTTHSIWGSFYWFSYVHCRKILDHQIVQAIFIGDEICFLEYSSQFELFQHSCFVRLSRASANRSKLRRCVKKMNGSILVNGSQRSELVILVSKGKRYGPIMASAPANKENVSPEKDIDCLSDSFQKSLTMNHVDKDGRYFLDLMERESERLMRLCQGTEQEMASKTLPEDGKIFWEKSSQSCTIYIHWKVHRWI